MRRFLMLIAALALAGATLAARSMADDKPDGPPPGQGGGGPGGGAPGGAGGPGGGPPAGGVHVIPRFALDKLNLTDDQKKQIADLEKDVKDKLSKILTADQMKTLEDARPPRGGGGPGGQGGGAQGGGQGGADQGGAGGPPKRGQRPSN